MTASLTFKTDTSKRSQRAGMHILRSPVDMLQRNDTFPVREEYNILRQVDTIQILQVLHQYDFYNNV